MAESMHANVAFAEPEAGTTLKRELERELEAEARGRRTGADGAQMFTDTAQLDGALMFTDT